MFARKYLDAAEQAVSSAAGRLDAVRKAAEIVVGTVTDGKRVFVADRLGIVETELADKPGNLALFRSLSRSGETLATGDVLVVSSCVPDNSGDIEMVDAARTLGARVIAIAPEGALSSKADVALTMGGGDLNAIFPVEGVDRPFGPVSGIANMLMFNMLQAETAARLIASGKKPTVLPADYIPGGRGKRIEALRAFDERKY